MLLETCLLLSPFFSDSPHSCCTSIKSKISNTKKVDFPLCEPLQNRAGRTGLPEAENLMVARAKARAQTAHKTRAEFLFPTCRVSVSNMFA